MPPHACSVGMKESIADATNAIMNNTKSILYFVFDMEIVERMDI